MLNWSVADDNKVCKFLLNVSIFVKTFSISESS